MALAAESATEWGLRADHEDDTTVNPPIYSAGITPAMDGSSEMVDPFALATVVGVKPLCKRRSDWGKS